MTAQPARDRAVAVKRQAAVRRRGAADPQGAVLVARAVQAPAHPHAGHIRVGMHPDPRIVVVRVAGAQSTHLGESASRIVRDVERLVDVARTVA